MGKDRRTISIKDILSNIKKIQRFCMKQYGWTLTEVRNSPYVKLLEILNEENKEKRLKKNKLNKKSLQVRI